MGTGRRFTVDEAMHASARAVDWLGTQSAVRAFATEPWEVVTGPGPQAARLRRVAEEFLPAQRAFFASLEVVYADAAMADLLTAAADAMPATPLRADELVLPAGMVIFAKPLPALETPPHRECAATFTVTPRGISWHLGARGLSVLTWCDRHGLHQRDGLTFTYTGLAPESLTLLPHDGEQPVPPDWAHVNLLRALGALSRQPVTHVEAPPVSAKARRKVRRARGGDEPALRRVYLRRPHLAAHELAAARDARAGHTPRGHYVRGHWKHQWHPSIDEHRLTWVEGYLRGDFTTGTVPGERVLMAHSHDEENPPQGPGQREPARGGRPSTDMLKQPA
jgi:hypothetical protein